MTPSRPSIGMSDWETSAMRTGWSLGLAITLGLGALTGPSQAETGRLCLEDTVVEQVVRNEAKPLNTDSITVSSSTQGHCGELQTVQKKPVVKTGEDMQWQWPANVNPDLPFSKIKMQDRAQYKEAIEQYVKARLAHYQKQGFYSHVKAEELSVHASLLGGDKKNTADFEQQDLRLGFQKTSTLNHLIVQDNHFFSHTHDHTEDRTELDWVLMHELAHMELGKDSSFSSRQPVNAWMNSGFNWTPQAQQQNDHQDQNQVNLWVQENFADAYASMVFASQQAHAAEALNGVEHLLQIRMEEQMKYQSQGESHGDTHESAFTMDYLARWMKGDGVWEQFKTMTPQTKGDLAREFVRAGMEKYMQQPSIHESITVGLDRGDITIAGVHTWTDLYASIRLNQEPSASPGWQQQSWTGVRKLKRESMFSQHTHAIQEADRSTPDATHAVVKEGLNEQAQWSQTALEGMEGTWKWNNQPSMLEQWESQIIATQDASSSSSISHESDASPLASTQAHQALSSLGQKIKAKANGASSSANATISNLSLDSTPPTSASTGLRSLQQKLQSQTTASPSIAQWEARGATFQVK